MTRTLTLAAVSLCLLGGAACTPVSGYQGFQAIDAQPNDVKVGQDTRASVIAKLGSPTAKSTFDKDTWFYLSQTYSKTAFYRPRITRRDVVAIAFDKDSQQVASVRIFTLKDGRVIAYNNHETPTRGREITFIEQMFGSLGTIGTLPPQPDVTPGQSGP